MNPIIKQQLKNCRIARVPEFDDSAEQIIIRRGSDYNISPYQIGKCYLIELADYIINPPADFNLADNWNQGKIPKYKYYKCEIKQITGKMVKFMGFGYDIVNNQDSNYVWEGWAPQKGIKIIEELK